MQTERGRLLLQRWKMTAPTFGRRLYILNGLWLISQRRHSVAEQIAHIVSDFAAHKDRELKETKQVSLSGDGDFGPKLDAFYRRECLTTRCIQGLMGFRVERNIR